MEPTLSPTKALKIKLILLLSILWMIGSSVFSQNKNSISAKQFAADFFNAQQQKKIGLKGAVSASALTQNYQSSVKVKNPLFVFQKADKGFAIVAQNKQDFEVIGYSDEGDFQSENMPPQLRALLSYYEDSLQFNENPPRELKSGATTVAPLLREQQIKLNQFHHAEVDGGWTGCVATAFTQIMLFHAAEQNKPNKGFGSHCYTHPNYGELCANFEGVSYDSEELLSYHVGISMDMFYTNTDAGSSPIRGTDIPARLDKHFKYYVGNCINEDFYIKNELEHRRPVYAAINGFPVGHAIVIDGYDARNYYHLNFGWGGTFDGYFLMNINTWYATGNFNRRYSSNFATNYTVSPTTPIANKEDSLALVAAHHAMGGFEATKWDLTKPVYKWPGVLLMNGRVIRLGLQSETAPLTSQSIAPEIGNLLKLQELSIYGCLSGNIPSTITKLTELKKLHIANSTVFIAPTLYKGNFKGTLPADIDKLTQLQWLSISNGLQGTLPASIGDLPNLKLLYIYQDTTYFDNGALTGSIPESIGNLSQLQTLHITNQKLNGKLPDGIGNLSNLWDINLSGNQMSGIVPAMNLPKVEYLNLNHNQFSSISNQIWDCPKLKDLQLQNNQIAGALPESFAGFSFLEHLNLSDNKIKTLPKEFGKSTKLRTLYLDNNQLEALPDGVATIVNLNHLSASNNQITHVPNNLGQSRMLQTLNLSKNQLTSIPAELGNCSSLQQILLSDNKIGSIPASFVNMNSAYSIHLDNNDICGKLACNMLLNPSGSKEVRLFNNRFVFNDIPKVSNLKFGVRDQKNVSLKKHIYKVQIGDTVIIDIRNISRLTDLKNEYYWICYPNYINYQSVELLEGAKNNPLFKIVINAQNVNNKYYCKVLNPETPTFSFDYMGSIVTPPCMVYLNSETIEFKLVSDEELIAEKYNKEIVTTLSSITDKTISDGSVILVPPLKIKRGKVHWEASADGITWERISETMSRSDLKANVKSVSNNALVLAPKNTAYYRCSLQDTDCDLIYSEKLQVKALGKVLFDDIINVTEASHTITVDSIEVFMAKGFHDNVFRLTITKMDNPPASPESVKRSSVYDVNVSFGSVFEIPLLIKFKNINMETFNEMDIGKYKAAFFDDKNQKWETYDNSGISLKDSTVEFYTNHLTKLAWFELAHGSFTHIHATKYVNIIYKWGVGADWIGFTEYERNMDKKKPQPWHNSNSDPDNGGTPYMIQDMGEYMDQIIQKFKILELKTPGLRFNVYVDNSKPHSGEIGIFGYMAGRGYFFVNPMYTLTANDLRRTIAHEYMHYTQDYYMIVAFQNYWWQEAHAPLADRLVWTNEIQEESEPEFLLKAALNPSKENKSIFDILSKSWYDDKDIPLISKAFTNSLDPNLASTFFHYMRDYRSGAKKLKPDILLKETTWFGSWVTYLATYVSNHLDSNLGDEYEDYVKYLLTGENENFTVINKNGNPYAYLQNPANNGVFTHPISYRFKEGDVMVQQDEIDMSVPYMGAKIVLFENTNPDTTILVNYKRKHNYNVRNRIYHATYDFKKGEMTYLNISDSIEYNFLLENRSDENSLTKFNNYSFLLLINKEYIGASSLIKDFDASFELTAMPVMNIENIGMMTIYNGSDQLKHNFGDASYDIYLGSANAAYFQNATDFNVSMINNGTTKRIVNSSTYCITTQFTRIIDQGFIKGMPTLKDITVFTQTIDHDVLTGSLKISEHEKTSREYHDYVGLVQGSNGDIEEQLMFSAYVHRIEDKTKTYWLQDIMNYVGEEGITTAYKNPYGDHIMVFTTNNTSETRNMVRKCDAHYTEVEFAMDGEVTSSKESDYISTDYSSPDLKVNLVIRTKPNMD